MRIRGEQNLPLQKGSLVWGLFRAEKKSQPKRLGRKLWPSPDCLEDVDRGRVAGREPSPETTIVWTRHADREEASNVCWNPSLWPLSGPANLHSPNAHVSIPMPTASLPFELWNCHLQHPLLPLAENGTYGEGSRHSNELPGFPGSLPCTHGIKLLIFSC